MTEKLYYKDSYIREFCATVLSVESLDGKTLAVLDKTAFFPEEGGQSADRGYIGDVRVLDVFEREGTVYHVTDGEPPLGEVFCKIDFDERYEKMQCHTAEHILCGIIHRLYGLENVGFHLGEELVTFDVSAPLTRAELDTVEELANRAVFDNIPVETLTPLPEELASLSYRAKLDIKEGVRIVKIGEVDSCACCAPHVASTGEIGLIKILDFMKHRGGTRIFMVAGRRALLDYRRKYENILKISALLSVPQHETAEGLRAYIADREEERYKLREASKRLAEALAESVSATDGNVVRYIPDVGIDELRAFVNAAAPRVGGTLVALTGCEGDYKYIITSKKENLAISARAINTALSGRGGGKPDVIQGSFRTDLLSICEYFK